MLTREDLVQIETIVQVNIKSAITEAFQDFYDNIFEPHVTQSAREHKEILYAVQQLERRENEQDDKLEAHRERIEILEKRMNQ